MMTTMYKLLLFNLKAKFCQIDAQKHGKQIENQMLVANNRQSEWIGLQMMITMTVSQAKIKGDARWYPLHQRSGGNKVQVADSKLSEMYLDFRSKCYVTTKIVSRGTFLNTTGLAFSLGIAVAYLVIILNSSLPSPPSSVFGQLTKLILWIMSTLMETAL